MQTNQTRLRHLVDQIRELEGNHELIHRLISAGRVKDGKPYICLFEYGDDSDYLKTLELSKDNLEYVESRLFFLYNSQIDSMVLEVNRTSEDEGFIATDAEINYDVVRLFNIEGITVRVDFTLSTANDDVKEGPMTDLYYTFGILTIQGV